MNGERAVGGRRGARAVVGFLIALAVTFTAPAVGALAQFASDTMSVWYPALAKPVGTPPTWVFGPVWTTLYTMMAVAAWLVWRRDDAASSASRRRALIAWGAQLALNALWTPLFFGLQRLDLALVGIVALWIAIAATIVLFARVSRAGAWLLVPYFGWVSYATYLNAGFWWLN